MMKCVFVEVALRSNEDMVKEPSDMFSKLNDVEYFHSCIGLIHVTEIPGNVGAVSFSSQPGRHETCWFQYEVGSDRGNKVINNAVAPFDECVTSFLSCFWGFVTFIA